jgi:hypothetical protein
MKNFIMLLVLVWFILGVHAAYNRGYFDGGYPRTCVNVGSAALTVIAGGLTYVGVHPHAYC